MEQGTAARQPSWDEVNTTVNSQSAAIYDGTDSLYTLNSQSWWELASTTDSAAIGAVAFRDTTGGNQRIFATRNYTAGGFFLTMRTNSAPTAHAYDSTPSGLVSPGPATQSTATMYILALVYIGDTTTDSVQYWSSGSGGTAGTGGRGAIEQGGVKYFIMGGATELAGELLGGIAEGVYHKGTVSAGNDADMVTYFDDRYGTSLPGWSQ